jgi:hypothetical protein
VLKKVKNIYITVSRFLFRRRIAVLFCGLIGFLLPMIYGFIVGLPIPRVQDEFSYLLAADTFASGRLTNPTPFLWQCFEAPHVLMIPSYMSKYPPMQGLFLAVGQFFFGHPIFGVWLSCGLAAAAVCWMLQAWTRPKWAFFGTLLMISFIGINSYWAQSFWGGMPAVLGGALFFGGFRRLFNKISTFQTVMITLGGIVLLNTRPFEGVITMIFALVILAISLLKSNKNTFSEKCKKVLLPGVLLSATALTLMGYYNFRVTGNVFNLPYSEHHRQYFAAPLFIFQPKNTPTVGGNIRLRELSDYYTEPRFSKTIINLTGLPDVIYLRPIYSLFSLLIYMPIFFLSFATTIFLYAVLIPMIKGRKWLIFIALTIVVTYACMSFATYWDQFHYSAHLTCCFFLLAIEAFRYFFFLIVKNKNMAHKKLAYGCLILLIIVTTVRLNTTEDGVFRYYGVKQTGEVNLENGVTKLQEIELMTYLRDRLEKTLSLNPDKYLLIVSYDAGYSLDDEIVFNRADLENTQIIWAHDLGDEKNKELMNYYKNRKTLMLKISASQLEIKTLPLN